MSRKLLMCNGKIVGYKKTMYYSSNNSTGVVCGDESLNIEPVEKYAYLHDLTGLLSFAQGDFSYPEYINQENKIAAYNEKTGMFDYTIETISADGTKTASTTFSMPKLLCDYGSVKDRLYWDEQAGEYMIDTNTGYEILTASSPWRYESNYIYRMTLQTDMPTSDTSNMYGEVYPWVKVNRRKYMWSEITSNPTVYAGISGGGSSPYEIRFSFSNNLQAALSTPVKVCYQVKQKILPTGIKEQIKIPIFGKGTKFKIYHTAWGNLTLSVECTDSVVYEMFEGESITPSFSSDTHVFCEDEPIYLEEVNGVHYYARNPDGATTATYNVHVMRTLGTPLDNGKYEYTVTATSADGTKTKYIKFAMDYQLLYYGTPNKMYWNDELGCYDVLMYAGYEYITNVDNFGTLKYNDYTIFTKETDDGKVAYDGSSSSGVYANGTFHQAGRDSIYAYTHTVTNGSTENGYTIGLCIHDVHTAEVFNARIAENGPIHVFYKHNTEKIYHTDIKKKIKLPWFGEGTTYTLTNGDIVSTFKIGLPTKYEHKITYKEYTSLEKYGITSMTTTTQPTIKDLDVYDICYSYESYIDTIINPVYLYNGGGYDVAIDNGNGTYSYNIEGTSITINPDTGGAIITSLFTQEIKLPYYIDAWYLNTTHNGRDRFYWDDSAKQYMLEKNSMRIVIDSAYGDVEFKPFSYSSYELYKGNCWEFALPDGCDAALINAGYSSQCLLNTNYQRSSMTTAYIYDDDGAIFHPDYHSTFEDDKSLVFHYGDATTLDMLDQRLKTKPLILILPIPEPITIATGIKKKITLPLTQSMCEAGLYVTMKNTNSDGTILNSAESLTNGILTIKVPVEYKTIEVPEPTYQLPAKTVLSGSSSGGYIDTKVKLFDTAKDSTVIIDFQNVNDSGSFTPENGDIVFHCRYESSSYKYRGFALVYETTYSSWRMMGNTTYNNGNLGDYAYASIDNSSRETYCWRYRYAFIFKAGILDRAINLSAESISSIDIPAPAVFYDEELFAQKAAFGSYNNPAYIGRKGTSSSNYYQGTIHDCKIWDGVALTDEQIQALYCRPYPKTSYEISNTVANTNNKIHTGVELFEVARDFTMCISFTPSYDDYTEHKAVLSCGVYGNNIHRLSIMYDDNLGGYTLIGCGRTQNILGTNVLIPQSATGKIALFIIYKNGEPSKIIDYSSGKYNSLAIASGLTAYSVPSISLPLTIGYQQFSTNDTATNHDVCQVWDGTIHKCIIWKDKVLTDSEIDYVLKYMCR